MDFEVLVIGGGPGGYVAALRAAQLGAKTALVEKADLGGTCLNRGCIPTKVLAGVAARVAGLKAAGEFGVTVSGLEVDWAKMMAAKDRVVGRLRNGVSYLLEKRGVTVYEGAARFADPHTVAIGTPSGGEKITARKIIIATGSMPGAGGGPADALSTDDILALPQLPRSLVVAGGGVVGIELAALFANLGAQVTVVEAGPAPLAGVDAEVAAFVARQLKRQGVKIMTGAAVRERSGPDTCEVAAGEKSLTVPADKILLAAPRPASVTGLDPGAAGVAGGAGGIPVTGDGLTNVGHIYAVGDVTGGAQLAHLASAQGIRAAEHAVTGRSTHPADQVPACLYTQPEAAWVGRSEADLERDGAAFRAARFPLSANGRSLTLGRGDGFVKILYDPAYGEILGVHIVGPRATEIIGGAVLAMRGELTVDEVATTVFAHPTVTEAFGEAAAVARGTPLHVV